MVLKTPTKIIVPQDFENSTIPTIQDLGFEEIKEDETNNEIIKVKNNDNNSDSINASVNEPNTKIPSNKQIVHVEDVVRVTDNNKLNVEAEVINNPVDNIEPELKEVDKSLKNEEKGLKLEITHDDTEHIDYSDDEEDEEN